MTKKSIVLYLSIIGLLLLGAIAWYTYCFYSQPAATLNSFDGLRAYTDVKTQVGVDSRVPGTQGHAKIVGWIWTELESAGWQVQVQGSNAMGHPVQNIVPRRDAVAPQIIIGAHDDTRMYAHQDPDPAQHTHFVPGANDGASGVAVLLGLTRSLLKDTVPVWLIFFDTEDDRDIQGWDRILGSRDTVSAESLRAVGETLHTWVMQQSGQP